MPLGGEVQSDVFILWYVNLNKKKVKSMSWSDFSSFLRLIYDSSRSGHPNNLLMFKKYAKSRESKPIWQLCLNLAYFCALYHFFFILFI